MGLTGVGAEDWYRGDAWAPADRDAFFAKLGRARKENRPEYLRIKGSFLLESGDASTRAAGVELLEGLIRDYPEDDHDWSVSCAHSDLARYYENAGDVARAVEYYRATLQLEAGKNFSHGTKNALASLIAREPSLAADSAEADELSAGSNDSGLIFRSGQFEWALTRMRLAVRAGEADRAAAYAYGLAWLIGHDGPMASRHPTIGLIGEVDDATWQELVRVAGVGDAEAATPLVEDFRRPDGSVEWDWSLVSRIEEDVADADAEVAEGGSALSFDDAARPVLEELRAAGCVDAFDLHVFTSRKLPSAGAVRTAAPILLKWMHAAESLEVRAACAEGLGDTRARKLAAIPVLDAFDALADPAISPPGPRVPDSLWDAPPKSPDRSAEIRALSGFKSGLGRALYRLARDEHFDRLAAIVRNPDHGSDRVYAFWALGYCKDPRVVDVLIELVDDEDVGMNALHCLKSARSERAEPTLRRLAGQLTLKRGTPGSGLRNVQIEIATKGLKKLEEARAAGRARP